MTKGSSPLARGLPGHEPGENPGVRIIPARAGFTDHIPCIQVRSGDHPRSRGVYGDDGEIRDVAYGSSPLARGLLDTALPGQAPGRIIPARAGFTHSSFLGRLLLRIIPARAGFTLLISRRRVACGDHPRSRGVYWMHDGSSNSEKGSSPLARGLPGPGGAGQFPVRIIPARAGFTLRSANFALETQDHPRSRGVYPDDLVIFASPEGSSPLARGLLRPRRVPVLGRGIIPARAGFTSSSSMASPTPTDHPRSRGVYAAKVGIPAGL